jgi:hypothetical protein
LLLCLLVFIVGIPAAQAQWAPDGALVVDGLATQSMPQVVTDGVGGAIVLWEHSFNELYVQKLDMTGTRQWATTGVQIRSAGPTGVDWPHLISDDLFGALIAWDDDRSAAPGTYIQRVNSLGSLSWTVDGLPVIGAGAPRIMPDGAGGAFVGNTRIGDATVHRFDASGLDMWGGPVQIYNGERPRLLPDGSGGVIAGWPWHYVLADNYVYGARLDGTGAEVWRDPVSQGAENIMDAELASDGQGGGYWVWEHSDDHIYAQRMDASGARQWTAAGVRVDASGHISRDPQMVADGAGGVLIVYADGIYDIYLNRLRPDGTSWWGGAVLVCNTFPGTREGMRLASDGHGGAFIVWQDTRASGATGIDVYAQHMNHAGLPQWPTDGVAICALDRDQANPRISPTGNLAAVIAWDDARAGDLEKDIYAQIVHADGSIGDPPFEVFGTNPARNESAAPTDTGVAATFNEVMVAPPPAGAFVVHGSLSGQRSGTFSSRGRVLSFDTADFAPGELVTVSLTDGITAASDGDPLLPGVWSFTVAATGYNGGFLAATHHAVGVRPWALCMADINGGGEVDLLTANYDDDTFTLLGGTVSGGFNLVGTYPTGDRPHGIIAADVDGDGFQDVITANYGDDQIGVFINDTHGTLGKDVLYASGAGPMSVCAGDFDADGDLDLATANIISDAIAVHLNNGDGTFGAAALDASGDNPFYIAAGDLDGDGATDLVTANLVSDDISVFLNDGTGGFGPRTDYPAGDMANTVHPADLDKDGDLDLVVATAGAGIVVFDNLGLANFDGPVFYATGTGPYAGRPSDVNGDGWLDLVYCDRNASDVRFRHNDGTGGFGGESTVAVGTGPVAVVAADFNGDGALELATVNNTANNVSVLTNDFVLSGTPLPAAPLATGLQPNVPNPFNPSTRIDYAVARTGHVRLAVYDLRGREIVTLVDEHQTAAERSVSWDGRDATGTRMASGVYFYRLIAGDVTETRKMVLVK